MEIIVEVHRGNDGRPTGTVRPADQPTGRPFSGNLEFLALVEDLYLTESDASPTQERHDPELTDDDSDRRDR